MDRIKQFSISVSYFYLILLCIAFSQLSKVIGRQIPFFHRQNSPSLLMDSHKYKFYSVNPNNPRRIFGTGPEMSYHYERKIEKEVSCGVSSKGIHYFVVESNSLKGTINLLYVQYDTKRGLPISTTAYHDSMNKIKKLDRVNDFRKYRCPELADNRIQADCKHSYTMTKQQTKKSDYTSFDRGHMTPANPFRFHKDALSSTFYCINMAPQDPFTNRGPWSTVEDRSLKRLNAGFVMTGLCKSKSSDGVTEDGINIPACYWKLICYKEGGKTYVVGFIGGNTILPKGSQSAKDKRTADTLVPRSQSDIISKAGGGSYISNAWLNADVHLLKNREAHLAPKPTDCIKQKTLPKEVSEKWS